MLSANNIVNILQRLEGRDLSIHQNRCVHVRNRNATCSRCADACTSGCITFGENTLQVEPDRCIGCGTCATACPTCAIEAHHPGDAELTQACLEAARANGGHLVVACSQICRAADGLYDTAKVVSVTCLGRVDESLILDAVVDGVTDVTLVQGRCAECEHGSCLKTAAAVCDTANTLLDVWHSPVRVAITSKFPGSVRKKVEKDYDEGRRSFFTSMKDEAKDAAAVTAVYVADEAMGTAPEPSSEQRYAKVLPDGTLPHFLPERRERLLNDLAEMGEPEDELIATRLWGHVLIDEEKCTSCQMCATFCPTGALAKFSDPDGTIGIEHAPSECVKCRCCEDICPAGALTISDEVFAVDLLEGAVDRHVMKPVEKTKGTAHSIHSSMKQLLGIDQVYE